MTGEDGVTDDVDERRRRDDTIELQLEHIRAQLHAGAQRMDTFGEQLEEMQRTNAVIHEHIQATCEVARAAGILLQPFVWLANRIRSTVMWVAVFAGSVVTLWAFGEKAGWW